jgi:hypothetical protein
MKSLKHKFRADGGTRTHSVAMSIGHMETIHTYITAQLAGLPPLPADDTFEQRTLRMQCLCYLAFSTLAWNLWTRCGFHHLNDDVYHSNMVILFFRNFETVKLQYRHFDFNCVSDDPQKVPFIKVNLTDRKGWQNRMASSQGGNIQGGNYIKYFRFFQ